MLAVPLLLAACAVPSRPPTATVAPMPAATSGTTYRVVWSELELHVYRDGPLARFGHNHVIASTAVSGTIELRDPLRASTLSLSIPLDSLAVDEPQRRSAAGSDFPGELPEKDREGTRQNMLGPALLDAARFPELRLASQSIREDGGTFEVTARVDIAGMLREIRVPARVELDGDRLLAQGDFVLTHGQLGLTPFSVGLGALSVRDDLRVRYRIEALRENTRDAGRGRS